MDRINGSKGSASSGKWRKVSLDRRGKQALTAMEPEDHTESMLGAHMDTEALRRFAEKFRKKKGGSKESRAQFELEHDTGQIFLKIFDADTGEVELRLTPEEVAKGLQSLEEDDDNQSPLSNFFIDLTV